MGTNTNLLNYSKQLAIKLRDPVADGSDDGKVYFAEHRFGYLTRGFGKLIRNLESINYDVESVYPQFYSIVDKYFTTVDNQNLLISDKPSPLLIVPINSYQFSLSTILDNPAFKLYKVIAESTLTKENDNAIVYYRGHSIKINNAFETLYGLPSTHYNPEDNKEGFYFFIHNGNIRILSSVDIKAYALHFLFRNPLPHFSASTNIDLVIPVEMEDLFLSMSALEGSIDVGNQAKVNLYREEVNTELTFIAAGVKNSNQKEKVDPVDE
jgi:hypothetical protein